jgi:hypothetical protein
MPKQDLLSVMPYFENTQRLTNMAISIAIMGIRRTQADEVG